MPESNPEKIKQDRRKVVKKARYSVPILLSLGSLLNTRPVNAFDPQPSAPITSSVLQQQKSDAPEE